MLAMSPSDVVTAWWQAIDRAAFGEAAAMMAADAVVDWPLSNERMASPAMWQAVNDHYPGRWRAKVISTTEDADRVVTVTEISDASITVVAISLFTVAQGLISHLVEYWPEPYAPPSWRAQWTIPIPATEAH